MTPATSTSQAFIQSTTGTLANPSLLDKGQWGSWGIALPNSSLYPGFNTNEADYSSTSQDTLAKTTWAAVPGKEVDDASKTIIKTTTWSKKTDTYPVYYGVRVTNPSSTPADTYTAQVVYTATTNEVPAPSITSISPDSYTLDSGTSGQITISGTNLGSTYEVYLTNTNGDRVGECTNLNVIDDNNISCTIPTTDIAVGSYTIHVVTQGGETSVSFTYTQPSICRNGDPDSDCQVDIDDNMIPVAYEGYDGSGGGYWQIVKDDTMKNTPGSWYDYSQKKWANAITLRDDESGGVICIGVTTALLRKSSQDCSGQSYTPLEFAKSVASGDDNLTPWSTNALMLFDEISKEQGYGGIILGFWVYIPRYAYKVMRYSVNDRYVSDSTAITNGGFEIVFETKDTPKKTPIACSNSSSSQYYQDCSNVSQDYGATTGTAWATHPAFSWLDSNGDGPELNGFWIGKFETTGTESSPTVLPNQYHQYPSSIGDMYDVAKSMGVEDPNNKYGNTASTNQSNQNNNNLAISTSHMLKNSEWGAVTYLASSKYGAGINQVFNNSQYQSGTDDNGSTSYGVTGCGPINKDNINADGTYTGDDGALGTSAACHGSSNPEYAYNGEIGKLASTTNNVYGVYDMAGGAWEYVMGSYTTDASQSYPNNSYITNKVKPPYVDLYVNPPFNGNNATNNNLCTWATCGGHALYETKNAHPGSGYNWSWGGDYSNFAFSLNPWFDRGGNASDGSYAGLFGSGVSGGYTYSYYGFRVALLPSK